MDYMPMSLG